jgi:hypothetical protein
MTSKETEDMLTALSTTKDADQMAFVMAKQSGPVPGETFSKEALDEFNRAVEQFIAARILYHWQDRGLQEPGPHNIKVMVNVTIDDKTYPPLATDRPWFVIDGTARKFDA